MKKNLLLLFFVLLFLSQFSSCSGKRGTTKANVLVLGAALSNASGGVMVYGHNRNTGDYFAEPHTSGAEEKVLELKNGEWSFTAISWQGADILEGNTRCAIASATLAGGDIDVAIDLAGENCGEGSFFGSAQSRNQEQQIKSLSFATCANDSVLNSGASVSSDCLKGAARSYQIILPAKAPEGEVELGRGLISQCVDDTTPNTALHDSSVKLPPLGSEEIRVPMVIQAFSGAGCGGEEETYSFTSGRHIASGKGEIRYEEGKVYAVLVGRGYCQGDKLTNAPFASGGFNSTGLNYICTADQLNNIGDDSAHVNGDYILMKDIDLSGGGFQSIGAPGDPFRGDFYGNNKVIAGYTASYNARNFVGLFTIVDGGKIKNLVFRNPEVSCIDCLQVGTLVGNMSSGATLSHVRVENPAGVESLVFSSNGSPHYDFGGVVGRVSGSKIEFLEVEGLILRHNNGNNSLSKVGGIVGYMESNAIMEKVQVSRLEITSDEDDANDFDDIGGVVGKVEDSQVSDIKATNMTIEIDAGRSIGGLIGHLRNNTDFKKGSFQGYLRGGNGNPAQWVNQMGGAVGRAHSSSSRRVEQVKVNAEVEGWGEDIGGVVGALVDGTIQYAHSKGTLNCRATGPGSDTGCGGIVGSINTDVTRTLSEMTIQAPATGVNYNGIGGIAGTVQGSAVVDRSHFTGVIEMPDGRLVGGIAGRTSSDQGLKNNTVLANISANEVCGGLTGFLESGFVEDGVSVGDVDCSGGNSGLLVGEVQAPAEARDSFTIDQGGAALVGNGVTCFNCGSFNGSDMRDNSNFSAQLDFSPVNDLWFQEDGVTFPQLNWLKKFSNIGGFEIGSHFDPITIRNASQWNAIGDYRPFMSLTFQLASDIDFAGGEINPVGSDSSSFRGTLQGNYRVFKNGEINSLPDQGHTGLFRKLYGHNGPPLRQGARIYNVGFQNISVFNQNDNGTPAYTGILAGEVRGFGSTVPARIEISGISIAADCFIEVSGSDDVAGGVVGQIENANHKMVFENIVNRATVIHASGTCEGVGGIAGVWISTQSIESQNISNHGSVEAVDCDNVGGIVGLLKGHVNLQGTFNYASVEGKSNVGGLVGKMDRESVTDSEAHIKKSANRSSAGVSGDERVGGIVGYHVRGSVTYVGNTASVSAATGPAGGVVGQFQTVTGQLRNSYNAGEITGGANSGGLVGGNVGPPNSGNYFFGPQNGASTGVGIPLSVEELKDGTNLGGLGSDVWSFPKGDYPRLPQEL